MSPKLIFAIIVYFMLGTFLFMFGKEIIQGLQGKPMKQYFLSQPVIRFTRWKLYQGSKSVLLIILYSIICLLCIAGAWLATTILLTS